MCASFPLWKRICGIVVRCCPAPRGLDALPWLLTLLIQTWSPFLWWCLCSHPSSAQPTARSTPIHHPQPCRTQPSSQLRNGAKPHGHTRTPHAHCPHHTHTPHTHALQSNGVRNGGLHEHPKLGSLPRGSSSTSSSSSTGPRHTKKLQSNPSITSQSSKRSKSSSKSNSSQIPTEAQDGETQNIS